MSRQDQKIRSNDFTPNPCKLFLEMKNYYTQEELIVKGKKKEVKVFDTVGFVWKEKPEEEGGEWTTHKMDLPLEFAMVYPYDFVNFKGWNDTTKTYYRSNEVNDSKQLIIIKNKDGEVFRFTLEEMWSKVKGTKLPTERAKEIKAMLKQLGVKQYSSIYVALRNTDGKYELANFQLKGSNLSGSFDKNNGTTGWWNVSKKLKDNQTILTHLFQFNDFITEAGELGEYGILNWTTGNKIPAEDNEQLNGIYDELKAYHDYYLSKNPETEEIKEEEMINSGEDDDDEPSVNY